MDVTWTARGVIARLSNGSYAFMTAQDAIDFASWCIDHSVELAARAEEIRKQQEQEQQEQEKQDA